MSRKQQENYRPHSVDCVAIYRVFVLNMVLLYSMIMFDRRSHNTRFYQQEALRMQYSKTALSPGEKSGVGWWVHRTSFTSQSLQVYQSLHLFLISFIHYFAIYYFLQFDIFMVPLEMVDDGFYYIYSKCS